MGWLAGLCNQLDRDSQATSSSEIPEDAGPGERYQGHVAKFLAYKGYGFIEPAGSDGDKERWIKFTSEQVLLLCAADCLAGAA